MLFLNSLELNHQTSITMNIWIIMTSILSTILLFSIIFWIFYYKKTKRNFLSIRKLIILSTYLGIFLIQAFIFSPMLKLPIPFSFDSITTITVAFMFGPLEGVLFGWIADTLRVFINGWSYQILPSLMYPMIALIIGLFGIFYFNFNKLNKWLVIVITQLIIFLIITTLIIISIKFPYYVGDIINNSSYQSPIQTSKVQLWSIIFSSLLFIILESLFIFVSLNKKYSKDLVLIMVVLIGAFVDRIMELIIRPFTQYLSGAEKVYIISLFTRILSSTYLIPTVTLTSLFLIKTSSFIFDNLNINENFKRI